MSSTKKSRKSYEIEYKRRIVQEYLQGGIKTVALAEREGRSARIEEIADTEGVSLDQAHKIRELEEELEATQRKLAQVVLECDLLKKILPGSPFAKRSSTRRAATAPCSITLNEVGFAWESGNSGVS